MSRSIALVGLVVVLMVAGASVVMAGLSQPGRRDLLPALPRALPKGEIRGILARGQIIVERLKWDPRAVEAVVRSGKDQTVTVSAPNVPARDVQLKADAPQTIRLEMPPPTTPTTSTAPATSPSQRPAYLFSYFVGNGEDGLHLAHSTDGYKWEALNGGKSLLTPRVGESKLMRDPCIARGPDGTFHMVWTTAWEGKTIGYASSRNLVDWSEQKAIPVMGHEPGVLNCWAPEVVYDPAANDFVIFWASTVPGAFPRTLGTLEKQYNHRMYFTRTSEFKTFAPTKLFYDPGFGVIDATFLKDRDGKLHLIVKDETLKPSPKKHLRIAPAESFTGPFGELAAAFTEDWVEGPTAMRVGDDYVVYFDCYRDHRYGAMRSRDLKTWEDVSDRIAFPKGARHGTVLEVPLESIRALK